MQLARVIGTVVATVKNDSLEGRKLLVVQTVDRNLEAIRQADGCGRCGWRGRW